MSVTFENVKNNPVVKTFIVQADSALSAMGYTEHNSAHAMVVANRASDIMTQLGFDARLVELTRIAGYMHDIGNLVNRNDHAQSGALMAIDILTKMGMDTAEIAAIASAIGNHDEETGAPVSEMAAAIILADKADMRRSRVRNRNKTNFDIHDRVNYSVEQTSLSVDIKKKTVHLDLTIDTAFSAVMDFFEIFLQRMLLCRKAAEKLGLTFNLTINEQRLL